MCHRLPANIAMDDLIQAGMMGLDQALKGFSEAGGASFDTYAYRRIHGAMLDELRSGDHVSRGVRSRMRKIRATVHQLENELSRPPRALEIAERLGWPLKDVHDTMVDAGAPGQRFGDAEFDHVVENEASLAVSEDDETEFMGVDEFAGPAISLERGQQHAAVNTAFARLDDRDRSLLHMLYRSDLSQQDVADLWGLTGSRVCQMHASAVAKLKTLVNGTAWTTTAVEAPFVEDGRPAVVQRLESSAFPDFVERRTASVASTGPGDWLDQAAARYITRDEDSETASRVASR